MKLPRLTGDTSRRQKASSLLLGALIGISAGLLHLFTGGGPDFARKLDHGVHDRFRRAALEASFQMERSPIPEAVQRSLVLVVIDNQTLERGLSWPIPRALYLELVRRLELAGARTIALDILFGAPGPDQAADEGLKQALARPSVVFPYILTTSEGELKPGGYYPRLIDSWSAEDRRRRLGFTLEHPDEDKVVRRAVLEARSFPPGDPRAPDEARLQGDSQRFFSFDTAVLAHYLGQTPEQVMDRIGGLQEAPHDLEIPGSTHLFGNLSYFAVDTVTGARLLPGVEEEAYQEGRIQLIQGSQGGGLEAGNPFRDLGEYLQVWSLGDLLEVPEAELPGLFGTSEDGSTGRSRPNEVMALVGVTVSGGHDLKISPLGAISGVAIHANILMNMMADNFLRLPPESWSFGLTVSLCLLTAAWCCAFESRLAAVASLLTLAGLYAGERALFVYTYEGGGWLFPFTLPVSAAITTFLGVTVYHVQAQKVAKEKIVKILQEVAPIPDLESLLSGDGLKVGSEEKNLTILFSDIRGYTDLSESLDPVTVTEMLNTYHQAMGEVFERYGGIIFDYQGDAQMVVFGLVPASQPNHAAAACKAGSAMVLRLEKLRMEWQAQGRPVFESGIGICTGPVAIGVLGSSQRKQYAAIGDATNTSARMQGKSKDLDSPVLITESTFKEAGDEILADYIGAEKVKGKREPLQVYGVNIKAMQARMGVHA